MTVMHIGKDEAIEAMRAAAFTIDDLEGSDNCRTIIHTFAGPFGADWDLDEAIALVERSVEIAWVDHLICHDLAVREDDKHVIYFDCKRPAAVEAVDPA